MKAHVLNSLADERGTKPWLNLDLKLPAARRRESSKCKVEIQSYCSSLALPAASCGECAPWSTFENANIVILLEMRKLIANDTMDSLVDRLDSLCRQITSFQYTL